MSRPSALTENVVPERRQSVFVVAVCAAGAFAFSVGFRGAWGSPLWNAVGPLVTAASCVAVLMSTPREKWWLAIAALYLQVVRLRGDAHLPLGFTIGLDLSWFGAVYGAFQGRRALAGGAIVACAVLMVVATLLRR